MAQTDLNQFGRQINGQLITNQSKRLLPFSE
jgi:hypothetical protein